VSRGTPDRGTSETRGSLETRELPAVYDVPMPGYRIAVSAGLLESAGTLMEAASPAHRYAIITDRNVVKLYGERLLASFATSDARMFSIAPGEASKSRDEWARLTDEMMAAGFGRDSAIVALGGGVVGDLAGFVAATYMRGIPYAQVPTTLLAMVDSSVGGKTGIDTPQGKNVVGAFHRPAIVVIDPETLGTLPPDERRNGIAEMIKHGVIADAEYFQKVVAAIPALLEGAGGSEVVASLIAHSVEIKSHVVRRDERENGIRRILNFGHTIGHAIERASNYSVAHGRAVAIGMVLEARLAERIGVADGGLAPVIEDAVSRAGFPSSLPTTCSPDDVIAAMRTDKKSKKGRLAFALPSAIGAMAGESEGWSVVSSDADIRAILR
jgi:3-dehydroquinate synthase